LQPPLWADIDTSINYRYRAFLPDFPCFRYRLRTKPGALFVWGFAMWGLLAWLALLAATVALAGVAFHFDLASIPAGFQAFSPTQQVAAILIALVALGLIASTLYQAWREAREAQDARALREREANVKGTLAAAGAAQKDFDAAVSHLATNDPEDAFSSIHKQLSESEARLALQRGRNEATDMKERLEEVRRRQQALREQIGEVAERRRAIEPVFEELKDRQRQLARSLDKIETDDNNNNFIDLLKEFDLKTGPIQARHQALQDAFALLNRLKEGIATSQNQLTRLQTPANGVKALLEEVQAARDHLIKAVEALETTAEGETLSERVSMLDSGKKDAEQRIARLEQSFAVLDAIRRDMAEFKQRQQDLAVAFAEVETDPDGKSLNARLEELDQFSAQTRSRLRALQEILTTLNRYRKDLIHSQNELSPLRAPGEGVQALIAELNTRHAELTAGLEDVETVGNQTLGARVAGFADNKRMAEQRIAEVHRHFAQLESIRNEIAIAFADLNSAFKIFV
jgi:predicted  nucleic acid-binding Zn-ribbon protein